MPCCSHAFRSRPSMRREGRGHLGRGWASGTSGRLGQSLPVRIPRLPTGTKRLLAKPGSFGVCTECGIPRVPCSGGRPQESAVKPRGQEPRGPVRDPAVTTHPGPSPPHVERSAMPGATGTWSPLLRPRAPVALQGSEGWGLRKAAPPPQQPALGLCKARTGGPGGPLCEAMGSLHSPFA